MWGKKEGKSEICRVYLIHDSLGCIWNKNYALYIKMFLNAFFSFYTLLYLKFYFPLLREQVVEVLK